MTGYDLGSIVLLQRLSNQDRETLRRSITIRHFKSGMTIVSEHDRSNDVFFIFEGVVAAKAYSIGGHETSYAEIGAGHCFGEFSAIDNDPRSATIECLTDVTVGVLQCTAFQRFMRDSNDFAVVIAQHLVMKLRLQMVRFQEFSSRPVDQRIRLELLRLTKQESGVNEVGAVRLDPAPTHQAIARKVNTHREAVSREISHLEKIGILRAGRQRIEFLDIPRLRKMALIGDSFA